jgi:hypothetical protein
MTGLFVNQTFHAVGTGTFKSGHILNLEKLEEFNWVYDCGSTNQKILNGVFKSFPASAWPKSIDMLVLSHFDDDHVNGVETLLRHCHVKSMILPYSEWAQSVREISVLGKKGTSASTALLQLNPLKWLTTRNFDVRVDEVVLIQGGGDTPPVPEGEAIPDPTPKDFQREGDMLKFSGNYFLFDSSMSGATRVRIVRDDNPFHAINTNFEFVFFNAEKDFAELGLIEQRNGQWYAKRSNQLLSNVKVDIQNTIEKINLHRPFSVMPANWRQTLKSRYEFHFGHSGKAKNNISLCMYAAPVDLIPGRLSTGYEWLSSRFSLKLATLCTGDIHLTPGVIADIKTHLGLVRWNKIGLVQVPHHGSQHSWEVGNAALLAPAQFVQCASGSKHHPHPIVQADLSKYVVHTADQTQRVHFIYDI